MQKLQLLVCILSFIKAVNGNTNDGIVFPDKLIDATNVNPRIRGSGQNVHPTPDIISPGSDQIFFPRENLKKDVSD